MNLAVHGLEGDIREANTFYEDVHDLVGKCDFVMANPPFNVDMVDAEKVKDDRRLPFGLPGVNKAKKVSNGNYLWISYFHSYLEPKGRAGFVMSSQASSAGHGEAEVRRKIVETGDVDVMISIRSNFFYTRTVPCELWHFDKGKPAERRDQVLMLDARNIYRKVTRKIYDFSPEQLQNLTAIVWLYRGQSDRFLALVQKYWIAQSPKRPRSPGMPPRFRTAYDALAEAAAPFFKTLPKDSPLRELLKERDDAAKACFAVVRRMDGPHRQRLAEAVRAEARGAEEAARRTRRAGRGLPRPREGRGSRLQARGARRGHRRKGRRRPRPRCLGRPRHRPALKRISTRPKDAVEQLKHTAYFERQAHWLLSRFPTRSSSPFPVCAAWSPERRSKPPTGVSRPAATSASRRRKWMRISTSSRPCATSTSNWPT